MAEIFVEVTTDEFDQGACYTWLRQDDSAGAIVIFTGLVRDFNQDGKIKGLFLEHYPAMTKNVLIKICQQASERFDLGKIYLVHRVGELLNHAEIVIVGVSSKHREQAFLANQFIMDFLKNEAPFWKKELTDQGGVWVKAKQSDEASYKKW